MGKADDRPAAPVQVSTDEGIMSLRLNRPDKLNALTYTMIERLRAALHEAAGDDTVRCVLLEGNGRSFCAGDDLNSMGDLPSGTDPVTKSYEHGYTALVRALRDLPKPVVAGIHGHCLGAGFDVALACDVRVVSSSATFGTRFIRIGLPAGAYLLPRMIGTTRAIDVLFTGRDVTAAEAESWGLVTELTEPEAVADIARTWARDLSEMPTRAIGLAKRLAYAANETPIEQAFRDAAYASALGHATEDYAEAKAAWREQRTPLFQGR